MMLPILLAFGHDPCADVAPLYAGPPLHSAVQPEPRDEPQAPAPVDSALASRLQEVFVASVGKSHATAMTATITLPDGSTWSAVYPPPGQTSGDDHMWDPWWASIGKMYTAAIVLQLVEEGKVHLDDPLSRWIPTFPHAERLTIEELLSHTSGVYSFQEDPRFRADPRLRTPDELIAIGAHHPPTSCPGVYWSYSNTGYVLLGRVIEAADDRDYETAVRVRLLDPLGLGTLHTSPAAPWAAGNIHGPASEMVAFLDALLDGRVLRRETLARQTELLYPMFGGPMNYGLGLMVMEVPASDRPADTWTGHAGGTPRVSALVARSRRTGASVGVALTSPGEGDGMATAVANALLGSLPDASAH